MHVRQRGTAHVNIFFFLVILVLFIGAALFAYVNLEAVNKARSDLRDAQAETRVAKVNLEIYQDYVNDITKIVGSAGEYAGTKDSVGQPKVYEGNPDPIANASHPDSVQSTMSDFAKQLKVPDPDGWSNGMPGLFGHVKSSFDSLHKQVNDLGAEVQRRDATIASLESAASEATSSRQSEAAGLNQQITQKTDDYDALIRDKEKLISRGNQSIAQRRQELTDAKEAHAQDNLRNGKDKETLRGRISAIAAKIKLINPPQAADGMVISASQKAGLAWINLGRRDMLPVGTHFEVISPDSKAVKAEGTVVRIENDRAELRITGLRDRFDPVDKNDQVRNALYSPGVRRTIFLMGRFSHPYNKPMVKNLLESYGNKVVSKLSPSVDLVLVGGDAINEEGSGFSAIEETADYKTVLFLGIEIATLHKVRDFLKIGE